MAAATRLAELVQDRFVEVFASLINPIRPTSIASLT